MNVFYVLRFSDHHYRISGVHRYSLTGLTLKSRENRRGACTNIQWGVGGRLNELFMMKEGTNT